jgi:diacylglycerol O-acyltransferase / wax synthase
MSETVASAVELRRTLDEKFLVDDATFRTAQPSGTLFIDPAALRGPDGTLDERLITDLLLEAPHRLLALRQRLQSTPLAMTTPAWVPVSEVDAAQHLRFYAGAVDADVLAGEHNPRLDPSAPLWSMLVADRGDVVIVVLRMSHALGDGLFGLRVLDAMTQREPGPPSRLPLPVLASPRTGVGVLYLTGAAWWRRFGPWSRAWHEYWRKPFRRRLRRWGGRLRRTAAGMPRFDPSPPGPTGRLHHAHALIDMKQVRGAAKAAGTSLHNSFVAVALHAVLEVRDADDVQLDVPISRRVGAGGEQRNHITMTQVASTAGASLADTVDAVDAVIGAAGHGGESSADPALSIGYASYLPWQMRRRFLGDAPVVAASLWPVLSEQHEIAVFGSSYAGVFSLAVSGTSEAEVEAVMAVVRSRLEVTEVAR